ncbi:MAG: acyl-CoA dehydratase activase [Lachnospiraceae bacterium]|nr:acyl-CoA dehydratase activase [Lachnospiraceae bacterium]
MARYGKWEESQRIYPESDINTAGMITAGIDVGTVSTEAVIMCGNEVLCSSVIRTGMDFQSAAKRALDAAMENLPLREEQIQRTVSTGFGHKNVKADRYVDEIHCHAKGARYMFGPSVTTVIDLGGQTVKAIRLHKWDRVRDFMVNDKCASGMGHHIEELCELTEIDIRDIGEKSLDVEQEPEPVSTTCWSFAQTETMGLLHPGFKEAPVSENEMCAAHMFAVAWRIIGMAGRLQPLDIGEPAIYPKLGFTGGMAKNIGITRRLEREWGVQALTGAYDPMLAGAIGAALFAQE